MKPTCQRVLRALTEAGEEGVTTAILCQPDIGGVRFASRLHELRHEHGFEITERRIRQGSSLYTLAGVATAATPLSREASKRNGESGGGDSGERLSGSAAGQPSPATQASRRSGGPARVLASPPYTEPPGPEYRLVWDYDPTSPNCGRSYWERAVEWGGRQGRMAA